MAVNRTDKAFYLAPDKTTVHEGDDPPPPDGSTVLAAPGGTIDDSLAAKHDLADKLKGDGEPAVLRDPAGNPIVIRDGRALAARLLAHDDPERVKVLEAARVEDEAKAKEDVSKAESDAPAGGPEASQVAKAEPIKAEPTKVETVKPPDASLRLGDPKAGTDKPVADAPAAKVADVPKAGPVAPKPGPSLPKK